MGGARDESRQFLRISITIASHRAVGPKKPPRRPGLSGALVRPDRPKTGSGGAALLIGAEA